MLRKIKTYFLAGLIFLIPLIGTIYVLYVIFKFFDGILRPFFQAGIGMTIPGLTLFPGISLFITILIIFLVGILISNTIGKKIMESFETSLFKIPLVRGIYGIIKEVINSLLLQKRDFQRVVVIEYPRKNVYALGFVTGESFIKSKDLDGKDLITVFVPTAPNPTSGMIILFPGNEVYTSNLSVEDALKFIVSGGFVIPPPEKIEENSIK